MPCVLQVLFGLVQYIVVCAGLVEAVRASHTIKTRPQLNSDNKEFTLDFLDMLVSQSADACRLTQALSSTCCAWGSVLPDPSDGLAGGAWGAPMCMQHAPSQLCLYSGETCMCVHIAAAACSEPQLSCFGGLFWAVLQ
jgi:hypothetical protein